MSTTRTAYDLVPYPGGAFRQTHPDRLATMATLYGLEPAPPERCRVLELGCTDGGNLIPMAYTLRDSEFLGIDLAESAVEKGQETIRALGLRNATLRAADVAEVSDLGTFDFVVAHGLYSWVPPPVQKRILGLCREVLAPHGVAYISYNAYPGNHSRNAARQMMLFHVRGIEDPARRVEQARLLIRLLSESEISSPELSAIIKETLAFHNMARDAAVFHDDLAAINEPLLFMEFVERAGSEGLAFLSEADYPDMVAWKPDTPAGRLLDALAREDLLLQQQYRDFVLFRKFRQTLLCRDDVRSDREARPARLRGLGAGCAFRPETPEPDIASDAPIQFLGADGVSVTTTHPLSKAAFLVLSEAWPGWHSWEELLSRARDRLARAGARAPGADDEERLLGFLLRTYAASVSELHATPYLFPTAPSERPRASAYARLEVAEGSVVTNLKHQSIVLEDDLVRQLLLLLDGSRDRAALCAEMGDFLRRSERPDAPALLADLPGRIDENLRRVVRLALLEA